MFFLISTPASPLLHLKHLRQVPQIPSPREVRVQTLGIYIWGYPPQLIIPKPQVMLRRFSSSRQFWRQISQYPKNDQIFIHKVGNTYVANLSSNPKDIPIGFSDSNEIDHETFKSNPEFLDLLNNTIKNSIQKDFSFIMEAGANANAFMPIYDFREIPNYARVPEVDDIFGYVLVDGDGKIIPDSYEVNQLYRLCNGTGLVKLTDYLLEEMRKATAVSNLQNERKE